MKKKLYYLVLLALIIIVPINAKALTGSVSISCDKEAYQMSDTATCKVTGTSDVDIYSVSAKLNNDFTSSVATVEFIADSSWQGNGEEGNIQLYTDVGKKGTFNIGTLSIKIKDTSSDIASLDVAIDDVKFGDTDGKEVDIKSNQKTVAFSSDTLNDNNDNVSSDVTNTTPVKSNTTNKTNVKNPSTVDTGITLIVFGIIITCAIIIVGYKKVMKKSDNMD